LRSLQSLRENPLTFLQNSAEKYGDIVQFRLGGLHAFLLNKPEYIQHVLQTNNHNYSKDTLQYNALAAITGRGLLTSDGELWLRQRRRMQPAFHRERTLSFGPLMVDAAVNMLEGWEAAAASGQVVDLDQELMRLTLEILGKALLGVDLSREAPTLTAAVTIALDHIVNQLKSPRLLPGFIPTRANRQFQQAIRTLNQAVQEIIDKHVPGATETSDLLSLLITAGEKADGPGMDARQLRDEVITILIAGHETVASALTWTCYLMAQHPAAVERMVNELEQTLQGRLPCVEDLTRLEYTRQVFDESLR
jgi:cytochrome P450